MTPNISLASNNPDFLQVLECVNRTDLNRAYGVWENVTFLNIFQDHSGLFTADMRDPMGFRPIRSQFRIKHEQYARPPYSIFGTCTCGASRCPHAAATLIELIKTPGLSGNRTNSTVHSLSAGALQLVNLAKQMSVPAAQLKMLRSSPVPAPTHAAIFCFSGQHISLGSSAFLKKGGLSKTKRLDGSWASALGSTSLSYSIGYHRSPIQSCLNDDDTRIIRELYVNGNDLPRGSEISVKGMIGSEKFIASLIDTGRAYSSLRPDTFLTRGKDSQLNFEWFPNGEDHWRLACALPSGERAFLVPSDPPWYIEPNTVTIGRVTNELPALALAAAEANTEIVYKDIEALQDVFDSLGASSALPSLPTIEVVEQGRVTPIAHLQLNNSETHWERKLFIKVWFQYPGHSMAPLSGTEIIKTEGGKRYRIERDVAYEREMIDGLNKTPVLSREDNSTYIISADYNDDEDYLLAAIEFQDEYLPGLIEAGWDVSYANDFNLRVLPNQDWAMTFDETEEIGWYNVRLEVTIGEHKVNLVEVLRQLLQNPKFVEQVKLGTETVRSWYSRLPNGNFIRIPMNQVQRLARLLLDINDHGGTGKPLRMSRFDVALLDHIGDGEGIIINGAEDIKTFHKALLSPPSPIADGLLKGAVLPLRPYQGFGVSWLRSRLKVGVGAILGDEMAIGKTVQTLSHIWAERTDSPSAPNSLIVVPPTLISKWVDEGQKFYPTMKIGVYHGTGRAELGPMREQNDAIVTTYGTLSGDIERFLKHDWHIVAMDEGHDLRNHKAQKTRACKQLKAAQKVVISGTILQNHIEEMWSVADIVAPGLLRDNAWFRRNFVKQVRQGELFATERLRMVGMLTAPYHLHRSNKDVGNALPPVNTVYRYINMGDEQSKFYEATRATLDKEIRNMIAETGLAKNQISILAAITRLRQICCHPTLVKSDQVPKNAESAKLEYLMQTLEELLAENKKVVITSEWAEMLGLIADRLNRSGINHRMLLGNMSLKQRGVNVADFREGKSDVLLMTLGVGGVGLDIPEGDAIIIFAPWWNPKKIDQAIARLTRDDRDKTVTAYFLVIKGSLEEGVIKIGERKGEMIAAVMDGDAAAHSGGLNFDDIEMLFGPGC
jgi:superfamily II DNA or RNA helicase